MPYVKKAVAVYMPVPHKGYFDLIERHYPIDVLLLSLDLIKALDETIGGQLERDMQLRAIPLEMTRDLLNKKFSTPHATLRFGSPVSIVNSIEELARYDVLIMPDEDISMAIHHLLPAVKVEFDSWFQRWDWKNTTMPKTVEGDYVITGETLHQDAMNMAKNIAVKSSDFWRQVGACVPLDDGQYLLAFNEHMPTNMEPYINGDMRIIMKPGQDPHICGAIHAELAIIAHAASEGVALKGKSIYVSTFPCSGCAKAIRAAKFKKVFFLEGYSNQDAAGILKSANIELIQVQLD